MNTEMLSPFLPHRGVLFPARFDEQVVPSASVEDLDTALIQRFGIEAKKEDDLTVAKRRNMVTASEDRDIQPTAAGILLGSANPQQWFPHAFVQAVAYRGKKIVESLDATHYLLDARDIEGPLDRQIEEACHFVARNQRVAATKTVGRMDIPQYDIVSVFEGLVNAVAHRDYSLHGSHIRLRMFCDRLEICSPGRLLDSLSIEALRYRQITRNNAVTNLLEDIEVPSGIPGLVTRQKTLMKSRGEGVQILLRRSEEYSGRRPEYRLLDESELLLTIFAAGPNESGYAPAPVE